MDSCFTLFCVLFLLAFFNLHVFVKMTFCQFGGYDSTIASFTPLLSWLKGAPPGINPSSRQQKKKHVLPSMQKLFSKVCITLPSVLLKLQKNLPNKLCAANAGMRPKFHRSRQKLWCISHTQPKANVADFAHHAFRSAQTRHSCENHLYAHQLHPATHPAKSEAWLVAPNFKCRVV